MLSEEDLDPVFDAARRDAFRLEQLNDFTVGESEQIRAYLEGEPYDPVRQSSEWREFLQGWVDAGVNYRKVHVVRAPLSDYERWEFEWGFAKPGHPGQQVFILDQTEVADPPSLPDYDYWMFDEAVVLRMHYDEVGHFLGAEQLPEPEAAAHTRYRNTALAAAVPFADYWAAHPQYWRENWLGKPG